MKHVNILQVLKNLKKYQKQRYEQSMFIQEKIVNVNGASYKITYFLECRQGPQA